MSKKSIKRTQHTKQKRPTSKLVGGVLGGGRLSKRIKAKDIHPPSTCYIPSYLVVRGRYNMHQSKEKKKKKRAPIKLHPRLLASCEFQPGKADNISNTNDPESSTDGRTEGKKRKTSSSTTTENEKRQSFFSLSLELERYIIIYTPYPPYIVEPPAPFSASLLPIGHKSKLRRHGRSGLTTTTVPSTTRVLDDLLVGVVVVFRLLLLSIAAVVPWVPDWRRPPVSI